MVKAPPAPAWPPHLEWDDLELHIWALAHVDQVLNLCPHHPRPADRSAQDRLVHYRPQTGRVGTTVQHVLPRQPQLDPPVDLGVVGPVVPKLDDRAGVVGSLEEPGDELDFIGPDHRRGRFQAREGLEPRRQQVAVRVPPARRVGLAGEGQEGGAFVLVHDPVEGE